MKKKKIVLLIILAILIISIIIFKRYEIMNKISTITNRQQVIQDITFNVYSNENDILKIMVTAEDTENGIDKLLYMSKDGKQEEIAGQGKDKVAIDYEITEDGDYEFKAINKLGQEIIKILTVDESYRNNLIDIQVSTETEISANGKVNIDYKGNEDKSRMYRIGENGTWTNYSGEFIIDSYNIIKNNLQNNETKTVTLYAKIQDKANNTVLIKKELNNIDVDIANKPEITYTGGNKNVVLKQDGIYLDGNVNVKIKYDEREDITNYYSFDKGNTWNLYTNEFETNETSIIAKSVKNNSKLEISNTQNCKNVLVNDAMPPETYDGDNNTYLGISRSLNSKGGYMLVDSSVINRQYTVNCSCTGTGSSSAPRGRIQVQYKDENNNTISSTVLTTTTTLTIPSNTKKIYFRLYFESYGTSGGDGYARIYNISI